MEPNGKEHPVMLGLTSMGSAWFAHVSPSEVASWLAALLNFLLIISWLWKHFGKALFIRLGWIKGKPRGFMESTDRVPLDHE